MAAQKAETKSKGTRGRPVTTGKGTGTETRKTGAPLGIRMTPEDRAAIEAKAEEAGLTIGDYMRKCALGVEIKSTGDKDLVREIAALGRELRRQGGLQIELSKKDTAHVREYRELHTQMQSILRQVSTILERVP